MSSIKYHIILYIVLSFHYFLLKRCVVSVVLSFLTSNIGSTLLRMFFDIFRWEEIFEKNETHANFLTNLQETGSTLMPADVLLHRWVGGKHACVHLIVVSPLVGLGTKVFIAGQAILKAALRKLARHEKMCFDNHHAFILFVFNIFGF
jgi:hypothetical protein